MCVHTAVKLCTLSVLQTPCVDNKDFAILRFHGGPPYEVCYVIVSSLNY